MKWRLFFITGFLFSHFISHGQDIHFGLVTRSPDDLGFKVLGMTQDAQGYLWLATDGGLFRYDGYQYSVYHYQPPNTNSIAAVNTNSPAGNNIECVAYDKAGYLWIAPVGRGLDRLDLATGVFSHFRHNNKDSGSLANDTVSVILQDHEGTVWIGTDAGLEKFDSKKNIFFHYRQNASDTSSISCNIVRAIYEDKRGDIWVGTGNVFYSRNSGNEGGLNKLDKKTGRFTRYMHDENNPKSLIANKVRAIFEDSRGNFWVGTDGDGLHTMDRTKGTFERHLYNPLDPFKLSRPPVSYTPPYAVDDHITFITEDNKQRIWIGTWGAGINVYDRATQKVSYFGADKNSNEKLLDNHFWTVYKAKDNILWISAWEGNLYKVNPFQNKLPYTRRGKMVFGFAEDEAHDLWFGTLNGLIHKGNNGEEEQYLTNKNSSSQLNPFIWIEKDNTKFWVTSWQGLYLFDPVTKSFLGYRHEAGKGNSLISDTVLAVKKGADNLLWIGTNYGLELMDTKTGVCRHFQNNLNDTESISNNQIWAIGTDKNQNVWVGTNSGLNRFNKQTGSFKRYLDQVRINIFLQDRKGNLWAGTDAGLFEYDKNADIFLIFKDESDVITPTFVGGISEDHWQNLWLCTAIGIIRLNRERTIAVLYGRNQGVDALALTTVYTRDNGDILFADTLGYFDFQPDLLQQNISAPIVSINNLFLNNIAVLPSPGGILSSPLIQSKRIRLNHDQNTLSFEFSSVDFTSEHNETHVLFMMQNYDNSWRRAGQEKKAYYFNLPPGDYIFKVKAFNALGGSGEKDIEVIISPPWWSTWWAYTLFAVLFACLVWVFIIFRSRKLKKENRVLEEKVELRTTQLNNSLENLRNTQTQLIQSEKMASLGELTAGIAHEIQNPLNFVNNFSEVNAELIDEVEREIGKGNTEEAKTIFNNIRENERKIIQHGKRADAIVKGMLQHSRKSSGQKEPTDLNALADEYFRLSYHGLRAKEKSFNATLKTDYDKQLGNVNLIPQDIGRVLLNLFNNAFYAVSEKKRLQPYGYEPTVYVSTKRSDNKVEIKIRDNGMGVPENIVNKIFQPFFTTKPAGSGTGLGLSLSYDIIKTQGGELKMETKEGEGAVFMIELPV